MIYLQKSQMNRLKYFFSKKKEKVVQIYEFQKMERN